MKKFILTGFLLPLFIVSIFITSSCSYHVAGSGVAADMDGGGAGILPGDIHSLAIPFFQNITRKPNVESVITLAVSDEFMSSVEVVDLEDAEAVLIGTIDSYSLKPISFTASDVVQEYRLNVEVSFFIVRTSDDKVLWQEMKISEYEDFVVDVNDIAASTDAEWNALKIIAIDTARLIKERILEGY